MQRELCVDHAKSNIAATEFLFHVKRGLFVLILRFFAVLSDKKLKDFCIFGRINILEVRFFILKSLLDNTITCL